MISVLTCIDFNYCCSHIKEYIKRETGEILNFIINPRYDLDTDHKFQEISNLSIDRDDGSRDQVFSLHVNANKAEWAGSKGGGGTCIICYEHKYRIEKYKTDLLRPDDHIKYKICQAKGEMIIIAEVNIESTTERRIKMGNWYEHDGNDWKMLEDKGIWD